MAPKRQRQSFSAFSKAGLRRMKKRPYNQSKTLQRVVDEALTRRAETKHVQRLSDTKQISSQMAVANVFHIIPPVIQGTGGAERIGDRITVKKFDLTIRMSINDAGGRQFIQGMFADTYVFAVKGKTSFSGTGAPTATDLVRFFDNNGLYKQYEGLVQDYDHRINDDVINLIYKKRQHLNSSCSTDDANVGNRLNQNTNPFYSISIPGLATRVPKTWVYDNNTETYPKNCNIFAVVVCTDASGRAPVGIEFTQPEGAYWVTCHMDYIDL